MGHHSRIPFFSDVLQKYNMISSEIKHRAIVHYLRFEKSLRRVSKFWGVSKSSLQRWVQAKHPKNDKKASKVSRQKSRQKVMNDFIHGHLANNPFVTLSELASEVSKKLHVKRSVATMSRYVKKIGFRYKTAKRVVDVSHTVKDISVLFTTFCNKQHCVHR